MSGAQSIGRGILSNWTGLLVGIVISFFLSPYVVRSLGKVEYGIWALALQSTSFLYLMDFGSRDAVIRYASRYLAKNQPTRFAEVLVTVVVSSLPIMSVTMALTALGVWLLPGPFEIPAENLPQARWAVFFAGLLITQTFFFNAFVGVISSLRRYDISNGIGIASALVRAAATVAVLAAGYGVVAIAVVQFAVALLTGLVTLSAALWLIKSHGVSMTWKLPGRRRLVTILKRVYGYGYYAVVHSIGQKIVFGSDTIIVAALMPVSAVTYYSIAGSLAQYLKMLVSTAPRVFVPVTSALQATGKTDQLAKVLLTGAKFNSFVALSIGVVLILLGESFIELWMGPEFSAPAADVLTVLAAAQIFSAPHNVLTGALFGVGKHALIAKLRIVEGVANLLLSYFLGKAFGLAGVAIGTAIPHFILAVVVMPRLACPIVSLSVRQYLAAAYGRPILSALPFVAATWWVSRSIEFGGLLSFGAAVCVLVLIYACSAFLLGMERSEQEIITKRLNFRPAT